MFAGDRRWALVALVVLWASYIFVVWKIMADAGSNEVLLALVVSSGLVLLFNTTSIFAMLSHYEKDKAHIYGLDIHYLDANKKSGR